MKSVKVFLCFVVLIQLISLNEAFGQQTPDFPVSYRVFNPFIFNPAIAGSKDFASADFLLSNFGKSNSQLLSGNLRLAKQKKEYLTSVATPEFTKIGIGGFLFNDKTGLSRNLGIGGTGSYHLQLDRNAVSFLSFGVTAKAIYNDYSGDPDLNKPAEKTFFPNLDAGIYYYNSFLYAGVSATNLLGNPLEPDSLGAYTIPVSRQFFLQVGYKLVISQSLNIVLEPSLIVTTNDSFSGEVTDMLKPGLKVYAGNYCLGSFFNDFDRLSFFLQYKYSKVYVAAYFDLPYNSPFYKNPIRAEFAVGFNISAIRSGISRVNHW